MDDVSIVVTAFLRPLKLANFLEGARAFYPDVPIIVADNGRYNEEDLSWLMKRMDQYQAEYMFLPFDCGVSAARNWGLRNVKTKYALICEDDFIFAEETCVEKLRTVLESDPSVGIAAGALYYDGEKSVFANRVEVYEDKHYYLIIPISKPEWKEADGVRYFYADYVYNFLLMRTGQGIWWDPDYNTAIEHIDLAIRLKKEGKWKVAVVPEVAAIHHGGGSPEYMSYRCRHDAWQRFYEKTGLSHGINGEAGLVYDLKGKKTLTYPEYVFKLLNERRKALPWEMGKINRLNISGGMI